MPLTIADFVTRWKIAAASGSERQLYQQHFLDLCDLLGQPKPVHEDPTHQSYCFERHVQKAGGGKGFADVWKRGFFAWEYKAADRNLDAAYKQLAGYRDALDNPPLLVVSDFNIIRIYTAFENTPQRVYEFDLDDLKNEKATPKSVLPPLELLRALFTDPRALHPGTTSARVTEEAAKKFLQLAQRLELEKRAESVSKEQIAHFLMRIIFCLFADSIGLLPHHVFRDLIRNSQFYPTRFRKQLRDLFRAMSDPEEGYFGEHAIQWFNGGLFNDDTTIELDAADMAILREASANVDWAHIEPAIFGTLFERSLDMQKRSLTGAHYTSREDILLLIEPVVMEPLLRRWHTVQTEVLTALEQERATAPGTRLIGQERQSEQLLAAWITELTAVRILDPACGSGNFLYMALRRMLDLWKLANDFAREHNMSLVLPGIVSPAQLYGIETDFYAHELASIVVWIGFLQWKHEHGVRDDERPILRKLSNIEHADAILRYDADGKPYEPEWPPADYIVGNPPFLGGKLLRRELGSNYVDDLFRLYRDRVKAEADLVVYWFEKARLQIATQQTVRAGLLATQAIRGGSSRHTLAEIQRTGNVFWAWADRRWLLAGAAVHVSMIAFDDGSETQRELDGKPVAVINNDLTSGSPSVSAESLLENAALCFMGTSKIGSFELAHAEAQRMLQAPQNVNGQYNAQVIHPWINGLDITGRNRGMYIIDFGPAMSQPEAAKYELPFEHVRNQVLPGRKENNRITYAERWWIHGEARPELRRKLKPLARYIATPRVSKHRVFAWFSTSTLPDSAVFAFARGDDYFFGVLHSRVHELWARAQGTQLREVESGFRYTPKTTFDTFPFPWPPGKEPQNDPWVQAIAAAAKEMVELRDRWLNPPGMPEAELKKRTLTSLYNARPQWLDDAHRTLDRAVFAAYGWPDDLSDQQILERLLALNHERAAAQLQVAGANPAKTRRSKVDSPQQAAPPTTSAPAKAAKRRTKRTGSVE